MKTGSWSTEDDDLLIRRHGERVPIAQIAGELDRGVPATYFRSRKIGLLRQIHRTWSEQDVADLTALVTGPIGLRDEEISQRMNRPISSIRPKMDELGLIARRTPYVPPVRPPKAPVERQQRDSDEDAKRRSDREARRARSAEIACERAARRAASAEKRKAAVEARTAREKSRQDAKAERERVAQEKRKEAEVARQHRIDAKRAERQNRQEREQQRSKTNSEKASGKMPSLSRLESERLRRNLEIERARMARPEIAPRPIIAVIGIAPRTDATSPESGRGGWLKTRRRTPSTGPNGRCSAKELSEAAQQAVAQFERERGVTRLDERPEDRIVIYLRRRGYVVVPETDSQGTANRWTIDHRHRIASPGALRKFAEARGYA